MFRWGRAAGAAALLITCAAFAAPKDDPPPDWAFVIRQPGDAPASKDGLFTVPGSKLRLTEKQVDDRFDPPDWFPQDHPAMPDAVAHGRAPNFLPCSYCHEAPGAGGPESASLPGLSADYIVQQFAEFRAGRRQCAVPQVLPCGQAMPRIAAAANDAEVKAAAEYYSKLSYHSKVQVVEAAMVPVSRIDGFVLTRAKGGKTEPIGQRILELADDPDLGYLGDWRTTFTAYVPPGSIARGRTLVASGNGAAPCASCHGVDLQGAGMVPPLAGRSPSYLVRQLYDIQYGFRRGPAVVAMLPEVAHMNAKDRIAIAAYLASLGT